MAENKSQPTLDSKKQFLVHRIYTKEIALLSPLMPRAFDFVWEPEVNFDMDVSHVVIDESLFEVNIDFIMKLQLKEEGEKAEVCQVNVKQAGVFEIKNVTEEEKLYILLVRAPEILFPFIQETVLSSVNKAGFPPVVLPMISFEPE